MCPDRPLPVASERFEMIEASRLMATSAQPSGLVLDTNIVLDCFVFHDPVVRALATAIEERRVYPLVHQDTLDELERVLAYPQCRLSTAEQRQVLNRYFAVAAVEPMPAGFSRDTLLLPSGFPQCRDSDDQPFLALAYHARAHALITRDKAILKLRRKIRRFGVAIFAPADVQWSRL
jgi:putative PIN family toxin of toxin-antitoxin system